MQNPSTNSTSQTERHVEPLLVSMKDAMVLLGLSRPVVARLVMAGKLRQVRICKKVMVRRDDIIALVEAE